MSIKKCPLKHTPVDILTSMNKMWCFICRKFYPFPLKPGKKSILIKGLVGGLENDTSSKTRTDGDKEKAN